MAFYNGFGKKLQKSGQEAIEKTKKTAEIVRLNSAVADLEKEMETVFTEIGKLYYEDSSVKVSDEEMAILFQKIKEARNQVEEHQAKIREYKGMFKCNNCGKDIEKNTAYCGYCGAQQVQLIKVPQRQTESCPNCGLKIKAGLAFCTGCGYNLDAVSSDEKRKTAYCTVCGYELEDDAVFCTNCGNKIETIIEETEKEYISENSVPVCTEEEISEKLENVEQKMEIQNKEEQEMSYQEVEEPIVSPDAIDDEQILQIDTETEISEDNNAKEYDLIQNKNESISDDTEQLLISETDEKENIKNCFCTNCGAELEPDSMFCKKCGHKRNE